MIQQLHTAAIECFVSEVKSQEERNKSGGDANKDGAMASEEEDD